MWRLQVRATRVTKRDRVRAKGIMHLILDWLVPTPDGAAKNKPEPEPEPEPQQETRALP
jgi:hypothetical protein